ncbi:hypothetical protein [Paenibacillus sp. MMS18-CY102]|uniref:hypothetical protein n=1 Tax=Paenibacillus sp. MMS18-CY102 TaxID=2682849 RepID=UPI0013660A44|nr:hypothetical protein [Paenibacillus sp. MMS18-CY102]MWC31215.1 hypothetical protein [Paenibacillus sp. MMS18-CY102]
MLEWIILLSSCGAAFAIPYIMRQIMVPVQFGGGILFVVLYAGDYLNMVTPYMALWIFGSLCGLAMRVEEAAREAKEAHEREYHY